MEGGVRMTRPILPTYYYLDHFTELLDSVARTYAAILTPEHHDFIAQFRNLSKDAQCLLIRMVNRRGAVFMREALRYAEIADTAKALDELRALDAVRALREEDYARFLAVLPKPVLLKGAQAAGVDARGAWPKSRVLKVVLTEMAFDQALVHCGGFNAVVLGDLQPLRFLLYLYFGKTEEDLKRFALRDLGIMRTNKAASVSARFSDASEAFACFHYSRLLDALGVKTLATYQSAVDAILSGPKAPTDYAADLRSRAACQAGQYFEKRGERTLAIQ
jgi:DNA polymerase-3 subunit epsilon